MNMNAYHHGSSYAHDSHGDQREPLWLWESAGTLVSLASASKFGAHFLAGKEDHSRRCEADEDD